MKNQIHFCINGCPFLNEKLHCSFYNKTVIMDANAKRPRKAYKCYLQSVDQSFSMIDQKMTTILDSVFTIQNLINGLDMDESYRKEDLATKVQVISKFISALKESEHIDDSNAGSEINEINPIDIATEIK